MVRSSHAVDCYPTVGSCPYQVYLKDGEIQFQEQAGVFPSSKKGVPDFNPMGCQKGACWHDMLTAKERVLYPLKRAGERGEGKWERISWDQALTEIADGIIDAIEEVGPEAVFSPTGANALAWGMMAQRRFSALTGFPLGDFDADIGDCVPAMYLTWGKYITPSEDDYAHSEMILIWHCNPAYTRIPVYHFVMEARYKGAEVVIIAPDFNPSAINTDYHIPVKVGSDAALLSQHVQGDRWTRGWWKRLHEGADGPRVTGAHRHGQFLRAATPRRMAATTSSTSTTPAPKRAPRRRVARLPWAR